MSNLQNYYHSKLDFQKVNQLTGGKWVIYGIKRRKDNQLQSLEILHWWLCIWCTRNRHMDGIFATEFTGHCQITTFCAALDVNFSISNKIILSGCFYIKHEASKIYDIGIYGVSIHFGMDYICSI